jgi:hypothetical protein
MLEFEDNGGICAWQDGSDEFWIPETKAYYFRGIIPHVMLGTMTETGLTILLRRDTAEKFMSSPLRNILSVVYTNEIHLYGTHDGMWISRSERCKESFNGPLLTSFHVLSICCNASARSSIISQTLEKSSYAAELLSSEAVFEIPKQERCSQQITTAKHSCCFWGSWPCIVACTTSLLWPVSKPSKDLGEKISDIRI